MSKMKYKVGDKVRVRQWETMARQGKLLHEGIGFPEKRWLFLKENRIFCGLAVTIKNVADDYYRIEEDNREWHWIDEMFEGYAFEYGEVAEFSNNGEKWERRIYVDYIDGSKYPYIGVHPLDENKFKKGENFDHGSWKYARPIPKKHKIIINGVEIEISDEDYKALKEKLCKGE